MSIRPESRAKFEKQGLFLTRRSFEIANMDAHERLEALEWIAEEKQKAGGRENRRYRLMLGFTIVAAVAAVIAAWPVVKDWLR